MSLSNETGNDTKMRLMNREEKVQQFRLAAGKGDFRQTPGDFESVVVCLSEEVVELFQAMGDYNAAPSDETRAALAKEWADTQYVISQVAVFFDICGDAAFNRVHDSNMSKVVEGKLVLREDGKILKPDTYVAPDMSGL